MRTLTFSQVPWGYVSSFLATEPYKTEGSRLKWGSEAKYAARMTNETESMKQNPNLEIGYFPIKDGDRLYHSLINN